MMKRIVALLWLSALLLYIARPVAAHSELVGAEPAPGAQLPESPTEIRLTFSEPVAAASQIVLLTEGFDPVEGLVPQFNPDRPEQVSTPLPPLEPGVYTVQWMAASADGHEVSGSYSFSVGLVTPGAPAATPSAVDAPGSSQVGWGIEWWVVALVAVAVGVPLVLVALRRTGK